MKLLALLLDLQDLVPLSEDPRKVSLAQKVVVVIPVDEPVPAAALARVVLEARAEGGQVKVTAGPQKHREAGQIPGPVGLLHMVVAAAVQHGGKTCLPKGETKGIGERKAQVWSDRPGIPSRTGLPQGGPPTSHPPRPG